MTEAWIDHVRLTERALGQDPRPDVLYDNAWASMFYRDAHHVIPLKPEDPRFSEYLKTGALPTSEAIWKTSAVVGFQPRRPLDKEAKIKGFGNWVEAGGPELIKLTGAVCRLFSHQHDL